MKTEWNRVRVAMLAFSLALAVGIGNGWYEIAQAEENEGKKMPEKIVKNDEEWRKLLTEEQYDVTRQKGTERAFTGEYWNFKGEGVYLCVACGQALFRSDSKFDSGSGWPSFWQPADTLNVGEIKDTSHGMVRTEVVCNRCNAHLGHVFPDGPKPSGLRYCINSVSLKFVPKPDTTNSSKD